MIIFHFLLAKEWYSYWSHSSVVQFNAKCINKEITQVKYTFCNLISYSLFCIDLSKLYLYYDHTGNSSVVGLRVIQFTHGPNACIHSPFLC